MAREENKSTGMSDRASDIVLVLICLVVLLIVAYPLYYVLIASVSDPYDVYAGKTFLLPSGFTLDGYKAVFAESSIVTGFLPIFRGRSTPRGATTISARPCGHAA